MNNKAPKFIENQAAENVPSSGMLIQGVVKARKINKAALARLMKRNYRMITAYTKNGSIQTSILWEMSLILKHNFFADIAVQLPADFTSAKDKVLEAKDSEIAALKQTVIRLQGEKDLLMQVIKK